MTIEKRKPKKEEDNMTGKLQPLADRVVVKPVPKEEEEPPPVSTESTQG